LAVVGLVLTSVKLHAQEQIYAELDPPRGARDTAAANKARKTPVQLQFTALDGRKVDLAALRGKVVLVNVWSFTNCKNRITIELGSEHMTQDINDCPSDMEALKSLYAKYHEQGLEIVQLILEPSAASRDAVQKEMQEKKVPWAQWLDTIGVNNAFAKRFGIVGLPTTLVFNKAGLLIEANVMAKQEPNFETVVSSALKEKATTITTATAAADSSTPVLTTDLAERVGGAYKR